MKTLTWHYAGIVQAGDHDLRLRRGGGSEKLIVGRWVPKEVRVSLGAASVKGAVSIDLEDDGVSLFNGVFPGVPVGDKEGTLDVFRSPVTDDPDGSNVAFYTIEDGSVLTLEVLKAGNGAHALTVELDLEEAD